MSKYQWIFTKLVLCIDIDIEKIWLLIGKLSASVAQLDTRSTGDQEVAGSTPTEVGNILSWRLIIKYFLRSFSPFR